MNSKILKNLFKILSLPSFERPILRYKKNNNLHYKYCILHIIPSGEKSYLKKWPKKYWIEIAKEFIKNDLLIYFTGAKCDLNENEDIIKEIGSDKIKNLAGKTNFYELVDLIGNSEFIVSVNTGVMHIAAAINCNMVAIHGPTNPNRWGPLSEKSIILKPNLSCSPCLNLGFEYGCNENRCMQNIPPQKVIEACKNLMKQNSALT